MQELSRTLEEMRSERRKKEKDRDMLIQQLKQHNVKASTRRNAGRSTTGLYKVYIYLYT